jgi:hypothetical protein
MTVAVMPVEHGVPDPKSRHYAADGQNDAPCRDPVENRFQFGFSTL